MEQLQFEQAVSEYFSWTDELRLIIEDYKAGNDEPLDGDEVDKLVDWLRLKINLLEGNITWEEYLAN